MGFNDCLYTFVLGLNLSITSSTYGSGYSSTGGYSIPTSISTGTADY
jgi:hypothetical protein